MSAAAPAEEGTAATGATRPVALVTGAGSGLGAGIVDALAAAGLLVVATDRVVPSFVRRGRAAGGGGERDSGERVVPATMDVTRASSIALAAELVLERFGGLDVLVNNAGVFAQTPALDLHDDEMERILEVNLAGALRCTAVFGGLMARRGGGRIINVASISGITGAALASVYAASKAGLLAATRSAARELAPHGIAVNAVAPGFCDTPMLAPQRALVERFTVPRIPAGRVGRADEVAAVVRYLAVDAPPYQTGSVIVLDGGLTSG